MIDVEHQCLAEGIGKYHAQHHGEQSAGKNIAKASKQGGQRASLKCCDGIDHEIGQRIA